MVAQSNEVFEEEGLWRLGAFLSIGWPLPTAWWIFQRPRNLAFNF
jgi:hypothetical protein